MSTADRDDQNLLHLASELNSDEVDIRALEELLLKGSPQLQGWPGERLGEEIAPLP